MPWSHHYPYSKLHSRKRRCSPPDLSTTPSQALQRLERTRKPKTRMLPRSTTMRVRNDLSSKIRPRTLLLRTFHCTIGIHKASEAYRAGCERSRRSSYRNKKRCQYKVKSAFCAYRSFIVCDQPHNLEPFRINLRGRFPLPAAPAMIKVRISVRQLALPHLKSTPPRSVLSKFSPRPRLPRMDGL
jgi:hypothetical protein